MLSVCMTVMVLMVGTDIETPTYYAVWWCLRPVSCLLRISSAISTIEITHSEGGGNPDAISIFQLPGEYS